MIIPQMKFEMALKHFFFAAKRLHISTVTPNLVRSQTASCAALSYGHVPALDLDLLPNLLLDCLQQPGNGEETPLHERQIRR